MQDKGIVKIFVEVITVILALVCIYYLSFSVISQHYESEAEAYAAGDNVKYNAFMDSVSKEKPLGGWFFGFTVKECRENELGLGLDLKGGMNVVMEVSVPDILKSLAGDQALKPAFAKSIKDAQQAQKSSQKDFLTLFVASLKQNDPGTPLASYFSNRDSKNLIKSDATDEQVVKVLRDDIEAAMTNSFNVLRSRIDRFGVIQPNIQRLAGSSRVLIEMPGIKEPERVRKLLQGSANLEFWETTELSDIAQNISALNDMLKDEASAKKGKKATVSTDSTKKDSAKSDNALLSKLSADTSKKGASAAKTDAQAENPLFSIFQLCVTQQGQVMPGPRIGWATAKDTAKVAAYFREGIAKGILPPTLMPAWTVKPEGDGDAYALIALYAKGMKGRPRKAPLTGDAVTDANAEIEKGQVAASVSMEMNAEGAKKWADLTRDNVKKCIAIVLDGYVYSYPRVNGEIDGGRSSITGNFTPDEAKDLANVLKSGKMPAPAKIVQEDIVGPSLGQSAITNGMISFIAAFVVVLLYMIFYYGLVPGLVADTALLGNVFMIFGILASFKAVLTLPGIAGIVLTLGMAVDANVLIYERTREELAKGKDIHHALDDGYSNAMSAIVDSNLTTILTGVILFYFGTGPIKGFATTLIIGILSSFFTAIFLSRLIFNKLLKNEKYHNLPFTTDFTKNFLQNIKYDFIGKSKTFLIVSGLLIIISCVSFATRGLKRGIDFSGGRNYVVRFEKDVATDQVKGLLDKAFNGESVNVITIGAANQVRISTNFRIEDEADNVDADIENRLYTALKPMMSQQVTKDMFTQRYVVNSGKVKVAGDNDADSYGIQSSTKVGPTMAFDMIVNAFIAVVLALVGIGLYILIRFRDVAFSVGSVVALAHDALLIMGVFSLCYTFMPFSLEVDQQFIAAILTIIGYSINDKVVIFDRIREYRGLYPDRDQHSVFNDAISSTLSRTFSTSMSVLVVLVVIFFFGGEVIRGFIFAMLIGVIVGTYSSVFVASPTAFMVLGKEAKKEAKKESNQPAIAK